MWTYYNIITISLVFIAIFIVKWARAVDFKIFVTLCDNIWNRVNFLNFLFLQNVICADLAISIPNNQGLDNVFYRIDYSPPYGDPAPNTTIPSREIGEEIQFSHALPGTKYNFWLYYTNYTHPDVLSWTVAITTGERAYIHILGWFIICS